MSRPRTSAALLLLFVLAARSAAEAEQTGENVLVVVNEASPDSVRVGEAYAAARGVPGSQVVRLQAPLTESIDRRAFRQTIEGPLGAWIGRHALHDRILYIVLTKGVPLRVAGTGGRNGTEASVDSELTLLYRTLVGTGTPVLGRVANPYYLGERPVAEARPFRRADSDIYLVTRLDGFTVDDALKLVERAAKPSTTGQVVLDQRAALFDPGGDGWLDEAAARTNALAPGRAVVESTRALAAVTGPVLGYYSWGSNDPANRLRHFGLTFEPGAIGGMFVSTDGRTFTMPPDDWRPGESERRGGLFASGSQSLAADLIRDGITGVSAHVSEPFLDATVRPQILFPAYFSGMNLAESYYAAIPYLSWQTMVIGDPLAAPFAKGPAAAVPAELDPETSLPAHFSARRLDVMARTGLNRTALALVLRADAVSAQGDDNAAEALLVEAVDMEPRLTSANLRLATIYEARDDHALARARYERILAADPEHAGALNNLAYSMAVRGGQAGAALPLAERALRLADSPAVADTVAWIHHLLGDDRAALPYVERALAGVVTDPDVLLHAAIVYAALDDIPRARAALESARALDPKIDDREGARALATRLGNGN